jgi:hypothetical protein
MAASNPDGQPASRLTIEERAERILEQTRDLATRVASAAELSHAIVNPQDGIAARAFPTLRERRELTMTKQYAEIYDILGRLTPRPGVSQSSPTQQSHGQTVMQQREAEANTRERLP